MKPNNLNLILYIQLWWRGGWGWVGRGGWGVQRASSSKAEEYFCFSQRGIADLTLQRFQAGAHAKLPPTLGRGP